MQEKAGEQGAAYIPMPKGRGFTPHFDKEEKKIIRNHRFFSTLSNSKESSFSWANLGGKWRNCGLRYSQVLKKKGTPVKRSPFFVSISDMN